MEKKKGYYFGTDIDGTWFHRYMKKGFIARGTGKYWFDDKGISFLRLMTSKPFTIPYISMSEIKTGTWHCGRWGQGYVVIKIVWTDNNTTLSSGFLLSKNKSEVNDIIKCLENGIKKNKILE